MQAWTPSDDSPFGTASEPFARQVAGRPRPRFSRVLVLSACVLVALPAIALASAGAGPTHDARGQDREGADEDAEESVEVCHVPPGNPAAAHTILVNRSALKAHLTHGDEEGACAEVEAEDGGDASDEQDEAEDQDQAEGDDDEGGENDTGGDGQDEDEGHGEPADEELIEICHVPPGNPGTNHTIQINASALQTHLGHGDHEGACEDADASSEDEQQEDVQEEVQDEGEGSGEEESQDEDEGQEEDEGQDGQETQDESADEELLEICHVPPGKAGANHTIQINASALQAHLGHGDHEGACAESDDAEDNDDGAHEEDNQEPVASFSSACTGLACTFDASNSSDADGNITAWNWSFGDGSGATGSQASHVYLSDGAYNVTLTVTDDDGASGTASQIVNVSGVEDEVPEILNSAPSPLFEYDCDELGCVFDASNSSDPDGNITAWRWSFGDGSNATGERVDHTYAAAGSYNVTLDVEDDLGAMATSLQQISVSAAASGSGGGGGGGGGGGSSGGGGGSGGAGGAGGGSGGGGAGGGGGGGGGSSPSSLSEDLDAGDDQAAEHEPEVDDDPPVQLDRPVRPPMPSDDADDEGPEENGPPAEPLVVAQAAPSSEDASGGRDGQYAPVQAPPLAPWYLFQAAGAPAVSFAHAFPAKSMTAASLLGHRALEQGVPKGQMFHR